MEFVSLVWPVALAVALAAAHCRARRSQPMDFADEAYLWHGTRLVRLGAVPGRDFRSYEPGRYWWCALAVAWLGDSLRSLRLSVHAFWAMGAAAVGIALNAADVEPFVITATMVSITLWAEPQYKLFEPALMAVGTVTAGWMLASGSPRAAFAAGCVAGGAALVGVNLAAYLTVGTAVLVVLGVGLRAGVAFGAGVLAGALPLVVWAFATGSARTLWRRRVVAITRRGRTNLPLPFPWPWREPAALQLTWPPVARRIIQGAFLGLPALHLAVVIVAVEPGFRDDHPALAATGVIGLVGLHHAISRADVAHLAQAIVPGLMASGLLLDLAPRAIAWCGAAVIVAGSVAIVRAWPNQKDVRDVTTRSGTTIRLTGSDAGVVEAASTLLKWSAADSPILAVPILIGLLVVLDRPSAVYDVFCVYPATDQEQDQMLAELRAHPPAVAMIYDLALDGREELRFPNTHPRVWEWVNATMADVSQDTTSPAIRCFVQPNQSGSSARTS